MTKNNEKVTAQNSGKNTAASTQIVSVDVAAFSSALKQTFLGIAGIFDSLAVADNGSSDMRTSFGGDNGAAVKKAEAVAEEAIAVVSSAAPDVPAPVVPVTPADTVSGTPAEKEVTAAPAEVVEKTAAVEKAAAPNKTETAAEKMAPTHTVSDIQTLLGKKLVQKKIASNDAVALLKKYGAAKVSDLKPADYDAFYDEVNTK